MIFDILNTLEVMASKVSAHGGSVLMLPNEPCDGSCPDPGANPDHWMERHPALLGNSEEDTPES